MTLSHPAPEDTEERVSETRVKENDSEAMMTIAMMADAYPELPDSAVTVDFGEGMKPSLKLMTSTMPLNERNSLGPGGKGPGTLPNADVVLDS